jgi:hypothetical protein
VQLLYDGNGNLIDMAIWTDSSMTEELYHKDFIYTAGKLTSTVLTRIIDSETLETILVYTGDVLNTIEKT